MIKRIEAILPYDRIQEAERALARCGIGGLTLTSVSSGPSPSASRREDSSASVRCCKLEVLVSAADLPRVYRALCRSAKLQPLIEIFVTDLVSTIRIRTGEVGDAAIC